MRSHSKALFAVAALFAFLLVPSNALAGKPVNDIFGVEGGGPGEFAGVGSGGALIQASGDFYVLDLGDDFVQRYAADGTFLGQFGGSGSGDGQLELGGGSLPFPFLAIDRSDGSVYVADRDNNRVVKFDSTGVFLANIGSSGAGALSAPVGVAVDPSDGSIYVADHGNNRVTKFDSTGTFVSAFTGEGESELSGLSQLAVDSTGAVYVLDREFGFGAGRVQKFNSSGAFIATVSPGVAVSAIAVDPTTDHLFAGEKNIAEFDSSGNVLDTHGPVGNYANGIAVVDGGGSIYITNNSLEFPILILEEPGVPAPSVTIDPVANVDSDSASFSGEVNPNGDVAANWRFQISADGGGTWSDVGLGGTVSEGTSAEAVSAEATGLEPSTEYQVRLLASKPFVAEQAIDATSFTTEAVPPVVEALYPGPVTDSSAWLGASINPKNSPTTFYVEYSTDPGFASSVSVPASEDASAGSGGALTVANQLVTGLQPQTVYHYRVVATNEAGTVTGASRSFTTTAVLPPPAQGLPDGRVWEKVSPADKSGADINAGNYGAVKIGSERSQAAVGGDAVTFGSAGKFGDAEAEGGPLQSQYLSRRGPGGWSTEAINPPMDPVSEILGNFNYFQWFSDDLSKATATTVAALNPGDPKDVYNLYLRDNDTRSYTTLSDNDDSTAKRTLSELSGVSADGEHFLFRTAEYVAPSFRFEGPLLERLQDGTVRPVSVLPDGSVVEGELGSGFPSGQGRKSGFNSISSDGSRIFFQTPSSPTDPGDLYVREDGATTTPVSAPERTGDDPDVPKKGDFLGASTDGSVAFFRSPEPLTEDTPADGGGGCPEYDGPGRPAGVCHLYRWDAEAPAGERLTNLSLGDPEALVLDMVGISDDGESVYFAAYGDIDGNGSPTEPNLYLWREGEGVRFVARLLAGPDVGLWTREMVLFGADLGSFSDPIREPYKPARATPDGRYLTFSTVVPQTAYDTNGKRAIYLYDSHTGRITCVSCGSVEPESGGNSWFVSCTAERAETRCSPDPDYLVRNFRADGKRLIFDSKDALVPEDTNGVTDVYEWQEGRLYLLSSGTSAFPSRFVDASADGDDVFFTTAQRLTASDKDDLRDLYDARVGGAPEPNVTPPCVGDECQGTPRAAPSFQSPSSSGFQGAGNARAAKPRCGKAKVRRRGRCVRRKTGKHAKQRARSRRANENRRAGR